MAQQTAVDWLAHQVNSDCLNSTFIRPELIEQAKAMEKEQIIDSYSFGYTNGFDDAKLPIPIRVDDAEQYYNETYNK
jgi:hypothetical protein